MQRIGINQKGVTMVEVMVTVAIIGIIAAVAIPSYQDYIARERLLGAAQAIYSQAILARRQAVSNNRTRYFFVSDDSGDWCAYASSASDATCASSDAPIYAHGRDYPGVTVLTGVSTAFVMPALSAASVSISVTGENGDSRKISISNNQLIRVVDE
ncbi:Fimbrial protein precursor [Marinobacterium sp. xm-d-579]|uniref:GspH/FimT family protein n=1 Tax=Marinobacterium sp. xm-d-579 TaxID=2497734 RepID=UPI00156A0979|nr:GspH/FimT family protein [Marinobacterium sp. xm-d-579]NRP35596.1 Fimbrial protein precursor [Marinobacterium sp. xm-d-579]